MKFSEFLLLEEDGGVDGGIANITGNAETDTPTMTTMGVTPFTMYTRLSMPQIPKEMKQQFHDDLKLNGYSIKKKKHKCNDLTPTQTEFNGEKVKNICASIADGTYKDEPILVSQDNKIVDGHHRWKAMVDSKQNEISTEYVDMTFDDLYKFLDNKVYVIKRDV